MLTLAFAACLAIVSIVSLFPPAVISDVPPAEFSSARARGYLQSIADKPHPIGSATHAQVRDYVFGELAKLGLQPQVQRTTAVNTFWGYPNRAATVENIVAKLQGTNSTRAVLLVAHYDAAPQSLGASDDGAAVATLLETLRALKASAPLRNDVIFLATDGEEVGLLGATAFAEQHPWAKDVGVVLNFEARGDHGPSIMFQTSDENGWLIDEFAGAVHRPVANSLSADIYKLMPNDTDFTVFKRAGMNGLNFAYVAGSASYHSSLDNLANLDERSLQHHGMYALALARRFGNSDLSGPVRESDAVYFDLFGRTLIHYSRGVALVLAALTALATFAVIAFGLKRKRLKLSGIAWGLLASLLSIAGAALVATVARWLIAIVPGAGASSMHLDTRANHLYLIGFVLLTVAVSALSYSLFKKKASIDNLATGTLLWFLLLLIISFIFFPGGSYLLMWPLLSALIARVLTLALPPGKLSPIKLCLVATLCAVPGIILMVPLIYQTFVVFGVSQVSIVVVPVALLLLLFIVNFDLMATAARWLLPAVTGLAAIGFIIAAVAQPDFNQRRPRSNELFYALNADNGKAVWASTDARPDEWTSQFLRSDVRAAAMNDYFPWLDTDVFLQQQASTAPLPAPEIKVLDDTSDEQTRSVHMHVSSAREAATLFIYVNTGLTEAFVNGRPLTKQQTTSTSDKHWMLIYYAPPREGIDLLLKTAPSTPLNVKVVDRSFELPEFNDFKIKARPEYIIPAPFSLTDSTFISKSFSVPLPTTQATAGKPANH